MVLGTEKKKRLVEVPAPGSSRGFGARSPAASPIPAVRAPPRASAVRLLVTPSAANFSVPVQGISNLTWQAAAGGPRWRAAAPSPAAASPWPRASPTEKKTQPIALARI